MSEKPHVTLLREEVAAARVKKKTREEVMKEIRAEANKPSETIAAKIKEAESKRKKGQKTEDEERIDNLSAKEKANFGIHGSREEQQAKDQAENPSRSVVDQLRGLFLGD